jgi:hypothetical protein
MTRSKDMITGHNHTFEDNNGCQALQEKCFFLGINPDNFPILRHATMTFVSEILAPAAPEM